MTAEECEKEYNLLKVRVMRKQEQVPAGAKKANKHYRPWEEKTHSQPLPVSEGSGRTQGQELSTPLSHREGTGESLKFKGIPYSEIISEWWQRNGGEPQEGERNVKLYQLAVNLRAICDNNRELLLEIMPRLGLDEQELRSIVESACKEPPKGLSKMLDGILRKRE